MWSRLYVIWGLIKENQHKAGILFRMYFEKASIGGNKAIDLQKDRISGSKNISIPDSIVNAISGLHEQEIHLESKDIK